MRRFLSLILLIIFLFNTVGYYALYQTIRSQSHIALLERLDNNLYLQEETITIKLPLAIPYQSNTEYERVNGAFSHHGEFYKLVKQKIENDTLLVVCIRDHVETKLFNAMANFVKASNDLPVSSKTGALKLLSSLSKDYEISHEPEISQTTRLAESHSFPHIHIFLTDHTISVTSPPPESNYSC